MTLNPPLCVDGVVYGSSFYEALLWKETSCRAPEQEVLYCDTLLEIFYYLDQHWSWLFLYQHTIQSIFALSFFQSIMSDSRTLRALIDTLASHLTVTIRHQTHTTKTFYNDHLCTATMAETTETEPEWAAGFVRQYRATLEEWRVLAKILTINLNVVKDPL